MPRGVKRQKQTYLCLEAFAADIDGTEVVVFGGHLYPEDHAAVKRYPDKFQVVEGSGDEPVAERVEAATAAPGESR